MEKMNSRKWLKTLMLEATDDLRKQKSGYGTDSRITALNRFFATGDLKRSSIRLEAICTLLGDLGLDPVLNGLMIDQLSQELNAKRFALLAMTDNPNGHNYGDNYFIAIRPNSGYRQDGNAGNSFPPSDTTEWKVPDPAKAEELADRYIELARGSNDWADYVHGVAQMMEPFVEFSDLW